MMRKEALTQALRALNPTLCELIDESSQHHGHSGFDAEGSHFFLRIASPAFEGKSLVECHRLIYSAVSDLVPSVVHALRIEIVPPTTSSR